MAFFLSSIFIFSTFSFSINFSTVPPLLSLRCTPSPFNQTNVNHNINPIETILDNLTMEAPKSELTTLNTSFRQEWYTGLMQCRPGLGPKKCTLCAKIARKTILNLCQNSNAVSAWFDGCYVQIFMMNSSDNANKNISNHSCSGRDKIQDPARFVPALGTLFLKLRADVNIATHHGFSHREIGYENTNHSESKIYGLVECVRSLSPQECDSCIGKATEKLLFYCGSKNGGTSVYGLCLVRFDSNEFYHGGVNSAGDGMTGNFTVWEGENGGTEKMLVMAYWSGGVACFLVLVLLAWLLRRTVLNRAKVGTSGSADFNETSGKTAENKIHRSYMYTI